MATPNQRRVLTLTHSRGEHENYALAASIVLIMDAERGEFDKSLAELKDFLKRRAAAEVTDDDRLAAPLVVRRR